MLKSIFLLLLTISAANCLSSSNFDEKSAKKYVDGLNEELIKVMNKASEAEWNYDSDITEEHDKINKKVELETAQFQQKITENLFKYNWSDFKDENLKRMLDSLSDLGDAVLPINNFTKLQDAVTNMKSNYAKVCICHFVNRTKCDLSLEPDLEEIFQNSQDPEELKYYWTQWYDLAGTTVKEDFKTFVQLKNEAAVLNG